MNINFFQTAGIKALGSRLRMLTEKVTYDAADIYNLYGIEMQPKWFPVFYALSHGEEKTITGIATEIGHSHPSVSKIVSEMIKAELIVEKKDAADGRRNMVSLSERGTSYTEKIQDQYTDLEHAIEAINLQATHDLWKAIEEWEFLLEQKSLLRRVSEEKKSRESVDVKIVKYEPEYAAAFKSLNQEWISAYFEMEEADYKSLDDPEGYILKKGGHILVALYHGKPVGVCALIKMENSEYDFELAKMAVSPLAQGRNIGWLLGQSALDCASRQGAKKIYLESNTILKPAINLYHKLGFEKVAGHMTPYKRCNIQMACDISKKNR
ncbi:bifunctional helix-turn-helix transcriptional regulator/GNAT family N-acetyltransferase [Dyadobacter sp. CY356]|uniref:bifunctional helix-turn-helix transcriptional regulator/GNAT family N-acetyltransferase n=1 Tax=Dyadobacter sp. CY356 TaxID=2906442 RepID=UPI001F17D409|nr:bifunctional helix-turn-helix transcriptional regulator/GNAT family N-acetyltransferase [Dyadobacter sp. CY356]MCF0056374.1 bifunctional helix-turn-helix transcriptional regulator/GNAT family N-acetyltransferase [Dyadobacter sp. CY356]